MPNNFDSHRAQSIQCPGQTIFDLLGISLQAIRAFVY